MTDLLLSLGTILLGYILGSIPFGLIIVRLASGRDLRQVESGRTGGTNAMRAAGFWAGLFTAIFDMLKAAVVTWLAIYFLPAWPWVHVLAPLAAVLGHNYSIFLPERDRVTGRLRLRGGAGGAPTVGGAFALWPPSILIIVPIGVLVLFGIGYASLATMSVAFLAALIFAFRAWLGLSPWQYIFYGVLAEVLLMWALRPNIQRLLQGKERVVGWRARRQQKA